MTKERQSKRKYILGQMDIDSAIGISKIDKLSDPLERCIHTLEKVVVKTKRQNKKTKARIRRYQEETDEIPQDIY
jgi:hypothetical protein